MKNQSQMCNEEKIHAGWLINQQHQYHSLLIASFKQQLQEDSQIIQESIAENLTNDLCLNSEQCKQELKMYKISRVIGSSLERQVKFDKHILFQMKDHKPVKQFPIYKSIQVENKVNHQNTWHDKQGDMARLSIEFEKDHTRVFIYMKDQNQALKWQRYLIIEKLLQLKQKQLAKCFGYCYQEYEDKFTFIWALKFAQQLEQYAIEMNKLKKKRAQIDANYLIQQERILMGSLIKIWQKKSQKYLKDEQDQQDQQQQLSLQKQQQLQQNKDQIEQERLRKEKLRIQMLGNLIENHIQPKNLVIQKFLIGWQQRSHFIYHTNPKKFSIKIIRMYIQNNIQLIRPLLELRFISERPEETKDIECIKILDGLQYNIKQSPYFTCRLLAQMNQQRRRDYTAWGFKDGLLGLQGKTYMQIENLGFKDYIDFQVIDTIRTNTSSKVLRIQFQDLIKYLYEGRSFWIALEYDKSKIFIEMDLLEHSNIDPIFLDRLKYIQLNAVLRKVSIKMIEQRTPLPIIETVKYGLEIERYSEDIQNLYQRLYIENICLQPQCQPANWFTQLNCLEKVVKPVTEILKRNYLEFTDVTDNVQIYYQIKSIPNLRLPLLKDVDDFMNKLPLVQQNQHIQCKGVLTSFLIYCNVRTIQLNVSFLTILFQIANKFICITHPHFLYDLSKPVFGNKYDSEAQAFWLFTGFVELMRSVHFPLVKEDTLFCPQEIVMQYMEVLHKEIVQHCKNYDIAVENVFFEILSSFYTSLVQSMPLCNIWNLIINKISTNKCAYQLVLIVFIEELSYKLLFCQNSEDFKNAISLQAQLMDIQQLEAAYQGCESNLNRIINAEQSFHESVEHSNIHQPLVQDC
ncbi:unnamed protein product [Paramecium primaurelia]|uniref:Rab-GAP TBC domain-containing protein n=1 Tax=Paramecium primaurelia TaxID=5886 RepID=A0A8S1L1Q3_PARPR|nr:unnamed protein product [Paramecium primaurelia]